MIRLLPTLRKINLESRSTALTPCPLCQQLFSPAQPVTQQAFTSRFVCGDCYAVLPWADQTLTDFPLLSAFYYQQPIQQLILTGKQSQRLDRLQLLGELMAERFTQLPLPRPEALLPVPLHPKRLSQRGFNQALELAKPLARTWQIPLLTQLVIRQRNTHDQKDLSARERQRNLHQAFALNPVLNHAHKITYKQIAIVDDVLTTGATSQTLATLLRENGVEQVQILAVASTV